MTSPLLRLEGVHTHIGAYHILHGVDLEVARGELTVLLGRNGAGKTTTLRSIMGLWRAAPGRVWFDGQDISHASEERLGWLRKRAAIAIIGTCRRSSSPSASPATHRSCAAPVTSATFPSSLNESKIIVVPFAPRRARRAQSFLKILRGP